MLLRRGALLSILRHQAVVISFARKAFTNSVFLIEEEVIIGEEK